MNNINLLPWRQQAERKKITNFYTKASILTLSCLLFLGIWHIYLHLQITKFDNGMNKLVLQHALLQKYKVRLELIKKRKQQLEHMLTNLSNLNKQRQQNLAILFELSHNIPATLFLTALTKNGTMLTLEGKAENIALISAWMQQLATVTLFSQINLHIIKSCVAGCSFVLTLKTQI